MNNLSNFISRFFRSVHFKIALIFTVITLITLGLVGAFFVNQYSSQLIQSFDDRVTVPSTIKSQLISDLQNSNKKAANQDINQALSTLGDSTDQDYVYVVDKSGVIRGSLTVEMKQLVGQQIDSSISGKKVQSNIYHALSSSKDYVRRFRSKSLGRRYETLTIPLESKPGDRSSTVGVFVYTASMESIYESIANITNMFVGALFIPLLMAIMIGFWMVHLLTRPITELAEQTEQITKGNYSIKNSIKSKDEIGILATQINDLSDTIASETATSNMESDRLNSLLSNMTDGVLAITRDGTITVINQAALDLLHIPRTDKAVGKNISDLLKLVDKKITLRKLFQSIRGFVVEPDGPDGVTLNVVASLVRRQSGFISGAVVVLRDVTRQLKLENDQKNFVSNVSHELRTPLTSVNSYIETLQEGALTQRKIAREFLGVAHDETQRMIHMINDLLELSRMDQGRTKMDTEAVNFTKFINYVLDRFDVMFKQGHSMHSDNHYKIIRNYDQKKSCYVEIDSDKFMQVVDNVINNAINYSPDGGNIEIGINETDDSIILSIKDHGLGIPKKDLENVFTRFYRVDKSRARKQGGTGLGLAISKEVVEALHGKIRVESTVNVGTTFFISLPKVDTSSSRFDFS
ncbi:ATP-binding protein [Oenococcus oeni]|uniref:ATP-binding protein n=1 Tax=Oenococcus oeni TaxID=1247 RepID=UPI000277B29D|nr:ATP-binding protein [Oenococcus oeni]EJN99008.1 PAS/PAC sensor signal transduction histidine kinase [Oenococcus oeni AWRIB418]OIM42503.1 PAS domain-containing sensor histidine kinase [Oenococcus oeni]QGR00686.1 cell wall metabolism sensor histidine kinase WalK [Oenococcus oeni]TEU20020.1 cell wall metabolism sensor histidine kinase WalK [Oenococcus oeni]TEU22319.1 cell wall metabolism sensor histidine kinase WalK [Oenococcus oeni]